MNQLKTIISVFLLLLLVVTAIPTEFYHECDHYHLSLSHPDQDQITEGDCPICGYTFSSPLSVEGMPAVQPLSLTTCFVALESQVNHPSLQLHLQLRAPPLA